MIFYEEAVEQIEVASDSGGLLLFKVIMGVTWILHCRILSYIFLCRTDAELRKTLEELSEKVTESQRQETVSVTNVEGIIYIWYSKQDVGF